MSALNRLQKVEAVIITHREYGEADRILKAITFELGKISILAKGVRKASSRKAPHIEPFTHSSLMLAKGQNFWILTQADSIDRYPGISENLNRTGLAAYLLELSDRLIVDDQPDPSVFSIVLDALNQINKSVDPFNPSTYFEIRLLDLTGFKPELFHCVNCRKEIIQQDQFFSVSQGGVICPTCAQFNRNLMNISQSSLKYLRHFQRSPFNQIKNLTIPLEIKSEIRRILDAYISSITERKLNSPEFIKQISDDNG